MPRFQYNKASKQGKSKVKTVYIVEIGLTKQMNETNLAQHLVCIYVLTPTIVNFSFIVYYTHRRTIKMPHESRLFD